VNEAPVLIVGAGPTGLVLALWLHRLGIPLRIIDKAAQSGTTSRALAVQARTLELYDQLGIADDVIAAGTQVANANFWVKGARVAGVSLRNFGAGLSPFRFALVFPQDAHEKLLIERLEAEGVRVERRTQLVRFAQQADGVVATLRLPDGTEEECRAAYVAGCDGASSVVRQQLGIAFPGGTYSGLFYVADVDATGPAVNGELHVDLEDADFVLVFPMRETGRLRLVGSVSDPTGGDDGALTFDDVRGKAIEHLQLSIPKVHWFSTYRVHHRVADRFRDNRAFLLGDAAHIHSPVGGQGMNTGIGDAVNLAWKLAAVLRGEMPARLLDTYEPERRTFARLLVETTDRAFTIVTQRGGLARFIRTQLAPRVAPLLFGLPATRRFMFSTVSQIRVNYRGDALSDGVAGDVHGGDRLPWVDLGEGKDNFAPLTALAWQAHVYGDASPALSDACAQLRLPLHVFAWHPMMRDAGLLQSALYLVRPDGYVALADPTADPHRLHAYVERWRSA
jgi:2-polyprenyl-6-methoxyphenol hydroxylase-like FAD-dependent oxidoreductase